mmetsp:Transcript_31123/g.46225  ORF Transcript_31123/g.46225 Transcript_31123/m.46225 type:complete len:211 (+) Transcript_31123:1006-1638(+)
MRDVGIVNASCGHITGEQHSALALSEFFAHTVSVTLCLFGVQFQDRHPWQNAALVKHFSIKIHQTSGGEKDDNLGRILLAIVRVDRMPQHLNHRRYDSSIRIGWNNEMRLLHLSIRLSCGISIIHTVDFNVILVHVLGHDNFQVRWDRCRKQECLSLLCTWEVIQNLGNLSAKSHVQQSIRFIQHHNWCLTHNVLSKLLASNSSRLKMIQ